MFKLRMLRSSLPNGPKVASWYLFDGLGSTRALLSSVGILSDSYTYDAFGIPTLLSGSANSRNPFLFTGQQYEFGNSYDIPGNDGLYFLRARYYQPNQGRFIPQDPYQGNARNPVTLHRYLYAGNDSVNLVDPGGRDPEFSINGQQLGMAFSATLLAAIILPQLQNFVEKAKDTSTGVSISYLLSKQGPAPTPTPAPVPWPDPLPPFPDTDIDDFEVGKKFFFHYTTRENRDSIKEQGWFRPSLQGWNGAGMYLTDLPPFSPTPFRGFLSPKEYSFAFWRTRSSSQRAKQTEAWIFPVNWVQNIYTRNEAGGAGIHPNRIPLVQHYSHFIFPTITDVYVRDRIVAWGDTEYEDEPPWPSKP